MFAHQRALAAEWLGVETRAPVRVHLVKDYAGLREAVGAAPAWAVAVARRDDVLAFRLDRLTRAGATSLDLVLRHEVVHQVLGHLGGTPLPRWFEEGLCVHHAGIAYFEPDASLERVAAGGSLPTFAEVDAYFRRDERSAALAYRYGHAAVTRFLERFGPDLLRRLLRNLKAGLPFEEAFREATGVPLAEFEEQWRREVTPKLPLWLFVLLENIELALLCGGALLVAGGYLHWRVRRERAMRSIEE